MPLFWISLAFLSGILLADNLSFSRIGWAAVAMAGFMLWLPPISRRLASRVPLRFVEILEKLKVPSLAFLPLLFIFLSAGAIRYQLNQPTIDPTFIAYYNDQTSDYVVDGVLVEPPDVRDTYINLRIRVEQIRLVGDNQFHKVRGLILARVNSRTSFNYGDRIRLQGRIATPFENDDFSYRDYLANQGIYSFISYPRTSILLHGQGNPIYSALYAFRQHAINTVYSIFPDPEASLLAGILLGEMGGISEKLQEAFRFTGTSHIIVISGFNITIIAGLFTLLFSRVLGRYKGAVAAAGGIVFYTLLVGANAAVVRAAILGMITLLGHLIGRRQAGLNSLTFVACVMAIITPTVLWDVSFQLSFAATLGIMLYAEPFTQWFIRFTARFISQDKAEKLAGPVGEYFLLTLAAQLTTLPLMVYYFKRISLTALIANPLILPAQPALMVVGGLSVLIGMMLKPIGQLLAWAAWPFAAYTIRVVEWLATIPHGSIPLGQTAFTLILFFYAILFAITFMRSHLSNTLAHLSPAIALMLLAIITVLVWRSALSAPDGLLDVTILDVGTGDAVLIQSPTGRSVLLNGGASKVRLSDALGRRLPPFQHALDWLVIADIDDEDLSGIASNLERFTPSNVLWAGNSFGTYSATDLWTGLLSFSIPVTRMQPGQILDLGSGASLSMLSIDAHGAVMILKWDNFHLLLPMGMDFDAMEKLQSNPTMRNVSAVLLAESGYASLNPPEFISFLHPQLALLSVAAGDKTGLPSPETLKALEGYNLLRTDKNGWIEVKTDGKLMWVEVERK